MKKMNKYQQQVLSALADSYDWYAEEIEEDYANNVIESNVAIEFSNIKDTKSQSIFMETLLKWDFEDMQSRANMIDEDPVGLKNEYETIFNRWNDGIDSLNYERNKDKAKAK